MMENGEFAKQRNMVSDGPRRRHASPHRVIPNVNPSRDYKWRSRYAAVARTICTLSRPPAHDILTSALHQRERSSAHAVAMPPRDSLLRPYDHDLPVSLPDTLSRPYAHDFAELSGTASVVIPHGQRASTNDKSCGRMSNVTSAIENAATTMFATRYRSMSRPWSPPPDRRAEHKIPDRNPFAQGHVTCSSYMTPPPSSTFSAPSWVGIKFQSDVDPSATTDRWSQMKLKMPTESRNVEPSREFAEKIRATAYKPSSNGRIERFYRTLNTMIAKIVSQSQRSWDLHLPYVMSAYRSTEHESTHYTPCRLFLGREVVLPVDLVLSDCRLEVGSPVSVDDFVADVESRTQRAFALVRETSQRLATTRAARYNLSVKPTKFTAGSWEWFRYPRRRPGTKEKWTSYYTGPFRVMEQIGPVLYRIQRCSRSAPKLAYVDKLKPFEGEVPRDWEEGPSSNSVEPETILTPPCSSRALPRPKKIPSRNVKL